MKASSCDEFVWDLLTEAQERGVRVSPVVLPRKYKIVIYSDSEPEEIDFDERLGRNSTRASSGGDRNDGHGRRRLRGGVGSTRLLASSHGDAVAPRRPSRVVREGLGWDESVEEEDEVRALTQWDEPTAVGGTASGNGTETGSAGGDSTTEGARPGGEEAEEASASSMAVDVSPSPMNAVSPTPSPQQMGDWDQVVAYYRSLQVCLQEVGR